MPIATRSSAAVRLRAHQQEYQDHLPVTERVQANLREDIEVLRAQEGWDQGTIRGVQDWVDDTGGIWRALRRNRYDPDKAISSLLSTLTHRVSLSLHKPIPNTSPYASSPLFHTLSLPQFITLIRQPIVVITLKEVQRDGDGKLDDLKEWTWWALEMVRRTLRAWWIDGDFPDPSGIGNSKGKGKQKGQGFGGEGCVLLVDAEGAGYRNLEVELLPTLFSVGHNHFPGMFDSVYVVNAGWSHRSMWTVVKRMLPKSALDKVNFLDNQQALSDVVDLDHLPAGYGGRDPWTFSAEANTILKRFSQLPTAPTSSTRAAGQSTATAGTDRLPSRSASTTSSADIFYTAQNTPTSSRAASRRGSLSIHSRNNNALGHDLHMTKMDLRRTRSAGSPDAESSLHLDDQSEAESTARKEYARSPLSEDQAAPQLPITAPAKSRQRKPYHRRPSSAISPQMSPLQRIKSLSDFHLYLSPSRLANLDLLSDSESDEDASLPMPVVPSIAARRTLRPVIVDPEATIKAQSLASRRSRPPLRLLGAGVADAMSGGENVRSYSDRLSLHHAHALRAYTRSPNAEQADIDALAEASIDTTDVEPVPTVNTRQTVDRLNPINSDSGVSSTATSTWPSKEQLPLSEASTAASSVQPSPDIPKAEPVSAYSRSMNPWFGYPAVRLSSPSSRIPYIPNTAAGQIIPLYPRNRKRDLVKTLLFLFMLRLQSFRDTLERKLGLHHLGSIPWTRRREMSREAKDPGEGLRMMQQSAGRGSGKNGIGMGALVHGKKDIRGRWKEKGEWVWMIIGFILFRGAWTRVLSAPLVALGLEGVRDVLGLG